MWDSLGFGVMKNVLRFLFLLVLTPFLSAQEPVKSAMPAPSASAAVSPAVPVSPPLPNPAAVRFGKEIQRPTEVQSREMGQKVQKVVFLQDDKQLNMVTRIYVLKHARAADLVPFIHSAVYRYDPVSLATSLRDVPNNREILIVTTGQDMMPYVDAMVRVLDRPGKINEYDSIVFGTGIAYGVYRPQFRTADSMLDVITGIFISSNDRNSRVKIDARTNTFYFKDTPFRVQLIKDKLKLMDQELPQVLVELKIYEVRDSDLKDIGIDYLAWKNGPGLNLFETGYDALNMSLSETMIQQLTQTGIELMGNFGYGFGGFYTAPAFDFSFIRILQQNGKAIVNSTAQVAVSNEPGATFRVNFSPEYQNILKDGDHSTSVAVGGDATITAEITDAVITGGKEGVTNFAFKLTGSNVVERNNLGTELTEKSHITSTTALQLGRERVIASWNKSSNVEQTIGIPFLCELPILKYIFGTTTSNTEVTRYFVTARIEPLSLQKEMRPGLMTEFEDAPKKTAGEAKK